ncbi:DUF4350 domain-containing protein [Krasilnikoviella flava]|uniref:DUF4350 domain-containing protein n=1 Tax=Krasilnikoviella flava TaxID=526729 RepID=A0A1T5I9J7_9MICO|nr:DUF4350 domain-containing protein [Krasilnikoviella flava]SKC35738.1 protein of unknown function [Krasilnikoviella flava]
MTTATNTRTSTGSSTGSSTATVASAAAPDAVTSPVVTGDGTTGRGRAARRWQRTRWALLVLAVLVLVVAVLAVLRPATSTTPYAPDNAQPNGARAVAQVLGRQGVEVDHVTRVADAVAAAGPGTTLVVTPGTMLLPEQVDALAGVDADLVLLGADDALVRAATDGDVSRTPGAAAPAFAVEPGCDLPLAVRAGELLLTPGLQAEPGASDVTLCWPVESSAALARVERPGPDGTRAVTAVDDPTFVRNDTVLDNGNAAFALGLLGAHETLVWLVPDPLDTSSTGDGGAPAADGSVLPPWAGVVGLWALLVVLVAGVWRARRLGPLVAEELPVVVRAAETTRGRGRLYRRARSRGHAAAGLRAATAETVARRLGVPRSADPTALTDAVSRATGRPAHDVADLLYGPPPHDDDALTELARRLDTLESEVHRS